MKRWGPRDRRWGLRAPSRFEKRLRTVKHNQEAEGPTWKDQFRVVGGSWAFSRPSDDPLSGPADVDGVWTVRAVRHNDNGLRIARSAVQRMLRKE